VSTKRITYQKTLRWRIVIVLLAVSFLPLIVAGIGGWIVFGNLLEQKALEQMRTLVRGHAQAIETTLANRMHLLQLLAETNSLDIPKDTNQLQAFLADLNQSSDGGFIDLGVIDAVGNHQAYVGPYKLLDKNYSEADWFKEVMREGAYVSDVFLGFREVPHCVIAVKSNKGDDAWIWRATINGQQFDELVKTGVSAKTNDVYIVNQAGIYQTTPNKGKLLEKTALPILDYHPGVKDQRITLDDNVKIIVTSWVNDNRWLLVVKQDLAVVLEPVNQAITRVAGIVIIAVILLVITTFFATWHLTNLIDKANAEREDMSRAFVRSTKLASIGELATGLAHEINNPLAIISAEQTNISDIVLDLKDDSNEIEIILDSVKRSKTQIQRCANITQKMLQFGRKQESRLEPTNLAPRMLEILNLLERRAGVRNIKIESEVEEQLPPVMVDPIEFEQVMVNLINNSIDALPNGGNIIIRAYVKKDHLHLEVADNGIGIAADDLERIFEPFFTTKPVSRGTGLGLSMCYGIVHSWGGSIKAESYKGKGTTIKIKLPLPTTNKNADQSGVNDG